MLISYHCYTLIRERQTYTQRQKESVNQMAVDLIHPFPKQALVLTCLQYKSFENTVGKGEIARNEQFLLFPTVFSTHLENFMPFSLNLKLSSANCFSLEESKICRLGKD